MTAASDTAAAPALSRTYAIGNSHLTLTLGDITTSDAQALVSSDDFWLTMSGGVSQAIRRAGGDQIAQDAAKNVPARLGDIVVTTAGRLPARFVFHAVTIGPNNTRLGADEIISSITTRCLAMVDALGLDSVALPALGTGTAGFEAKGVAVKMAEIIANDLADYDRDIHVTVYLFGPQDDPRVQQQFLDFVEEFARTVPTATHKEAASDVPTQSMLATPAPDQETEEDRRLRRMNEVRNLVGAVEEQLYTQERELLGLRSSAAASSEQLNTINREIRELSELRLGYKAELKSLEDEAASPAAPEPPPPTPAGAFVDFTLEVTDSDQIRASSQHHGEVDADFSLDESAIELSLELSKKQRTNVGQLESLGNDLYRALFPGPIQNHLDRTVAAARASGARVRLRLMLDSPRVSMLPWELLHDPNSDMYLSNSPDVAVARYVRGQIPRHAIVSGGRPLRLLVVTAIPNDQPQLDAAGEIALVNEALRPRVDAGDVEVEILEQASLRGLLTKLTDETYDIVHFTGHAGFRAGAGLVIMVNEHGGSRIRTAEDFAGAFIGPHPPGLVVLNACQGATTDQTAPFVGIARKVVQREIPAVVAMQYPIRDTTAKLFSEELYTKVAKGWPIDTAIQATRNAIATEIGRDRPDFAAPVLFLRSADGEIFSRSA